MIYQRTASVFGRVKFTLLLIFLNLFSAVIADLDCEDIQGSVCLFCSGRSFLRSRSRLCGLSNCLSAGFISRRCLRNNCLFGSFRRQCFCGRSFRCFLLGLLIRTIRLPVVFFLPGFSEVSSLSSSCFFVLSMWMPAAIIARAMIIDGTL